jgi:hypothetical protein
MSIDDPGFTIAQVDAAIEFVARNGAENRAMPVHYSLVFDAADLPAPQQLHQGGESELVTQFMGAFHRRCLELEYPPLDSLVVHVTGERGGVPGGGYFRINGVPDPFGKRTSVEDQATSGRFLEEQRAKCRSWGNARRRRHP